MKVEAIKVENGFLIPFDNTFKNVAQDKILLQVEIIERHDIGENKIENQRDAETLFSNIITLIPIINYTCI